MSKNKLPFYKNVAILSFSFTLLFTSYSYMENLQSSINKELGTTSLWTIYLFLILSSLFLPSLLIRILSVKWTIALSMLCYSLYIGAQLYPHYYTLIPSGILVGLAGGCLWTAMSVYITKTGEIYAVLFEETVEASTAKFFSLFYFGVYTSQVWGNLISSTVFSVGVDNATRSEEFVSHCGMNYCPSFAGNLTDDSNSNKTDGQDEQHKMNISTYICLVSSLLGALVVAVFVKPLAKRVDGDGDKTSFWKDLGATCSHILKLDQFLLIPLTFFSGFGDAFLIGDVTAGYISCGLGVHMVGYFMMSSGFTNASSAGLIGLIVKRFGQFPAFFIGFSLNFSLLLMLLFWEPDSSSSSIPVAVLIALIYGASDGVWHTQIDVLYGVTFPDSSKAAFSNVSVWKSLGYMVAFIMSSLICIRIKIYIVLAILLLGMAGYCLVKWRHRQVLQVNASE